jgi:hypothetical protein
VPADFSLLQTPNFSQAALGGYQAGQAAAKQRRLDTAMAGIDLSRPETLLPYLREDPSGGAALIGASVKIHAEDRAQQTQAALGNAMKDYFGGASGGSAGTGVPTTPALPQGGGITASPTPALVATAGAAPTGSPTDANGDVVVTAPHPVTQMAPNLQQTVGKLLAAGVSLDDATHFVGMVGTMTKQQAAAADDSSSALASVGQAAAKLPYEQRKPYIQSQASYLSRHGVSADEVNNFDPTDQNLQSETTKALGVKDAIAAQHSADELNLARQRFSEDQRHNHAEEATAVTNAATSRGQLGVAKGRLALAGKVAGGGGVGGASTADLIAMARGQKAPSAPSASDIFAIAGGQ